MVSYSLFYASLFTLTCLSFLEVVERSKDVSLREGRGGGGAVTALTMPFEQNHV